MAHGVEGRFPFLDHRVFAHSVALREPQAGRLREKVALREVAAGLLPAAIAGRAKQPTALPRSGRSLPPALPRGWRRALSPDALAAAGLFDPVRVEALVRRCRSGRATGMREGMALIGVVSSQLWHQQFVGHGGNGYPIETAEPRVRIDRVASAQTKGVA